MRPVVLALAAVLLSSACQTITPLQTATTLDPGAWRLAVQVSASPWCSTTTDLVANCYKLPDGVPVGELRVGARRGLAPHVDAGLSLHGSGVFPRGYRVGALGEAKVELWSALDGAGRHLVAAAAGVGAAREQSVLSRVSEAMTPELELVVPVFYGHQSETWELVASPRFIQHFTYTDITGDRRREALPHSSLGLSLSAHRLGRTRWAFGLDYTAPMLGLHRGAFTMSLGIFFDFGGERGARPPAGDGERRAAVSAPLR